MSSLKTVVVDYGIGNVFSVTRAFQSIGSEVSLTSDPKEIERADRLVLPGVGAFGKAADRLKELGHQDAIVKQISTGRPFLGICVGLQLLMETGTEFGSFEGLGVFQGSVDRMSLVDGQQKSLRIPQIGWFPLARPNGRSLDAWSNTPLQNSKKGSAFYFVHSFAATPKNYTDVLAIVNYEGNEVVAALQKDNVFGVQFHPERSGTDGLKVLQSFMSL